MKSTVSTKRMTHYYLYRGILISSKRLPKNKSCELRLKADNEILNAQVTILAYYKAV